MSQLGVEMGAGPLLSTPGVALPRTRHLMMMNDDDEEEENGKSSLKFILRN